MYSIRKQNKIMKTVLNKFAQFNQNYFTKPIVNESVGMNRIVFVEVENTFIDDAELEARLILERLGYDLEEQTQIEPYSEYEYDVWDFHNYVDIFEVMKHKKGYSLILLDRTIKNY